MNLKKFKDSIFVRMNTGLAADIFKFILRHCINLQHSLFEKNNTPEETPLHWAVSCGHK